MRQGNLNMKNILLCCITTEKNADRRELFASNIANKMPYLFYSDHSDPSQKVIKVSDRTDYKSGEEKHLNLLNLLLALDLGYKWYFFCDDDTYVHPGNLEEYAKSAQTDKIHGSIFNYENHSVKDIFEIYSKEFEYPSGGAGYLVSDQVLKTNSFYKSFDTGYGDASFGLNFLHRKIFVNMEGAHMSYPAAYGHDAIQIQNAISYHYIINEERFSPIRQAQALLG